MINNVILENCRKKKKNLSTTWIDYKKPFASVTYSWIIKCMNLYKVYPLISRFNESSMRSWKTNVKIVHSQRVLETGPISFKRGIFQGDSLSPLIFSVSLNSLNIELRRTGYGYKPDKGQDQPFILCLLY